jgi:hypothetical protein
VVSRVFLFGLFNCPRWELGNPSNLAFSCTHTAAMTSLKSVELKLGAKEPSMEEAKRCELKLPVQIKRTTRICCEGRVPTGAIASHHLVKEEKVPTPVRRSARICRAYTPSTHARQDEDGLLLEFPCNPIRTRSM